MPSAYGGWGWETIDTSKQLATLSGSYLIKCLKLGCGSLNGVGDLSLHLVRATALLLRSHQLFFCLCWVD